MNIDVSKLEVRHNPEENRFEIDLNGRLAVAEYMIGSGGAMMTFTHTEVPKAYEGQGIGERLAKFSLDYAVEHGYKLQPLCPYMAAYVKRHPEYHDHLI